MFSFIILPMIYLTNIRSQFGKEVKQVWTPKDPKLMVVSFILNFVLQVVDVLTDFYAGVCYIFDGDLWYGTITITVTFVPLFAKLVQEFIQIVKFL